MSNVPDVYTIVLSLNITVFFSFKSRTYSNFSFLKSFQTKSSSPKIEKASDRQESNLFIIFALSKNEKR